MKKTTKAMGPSCACGKADLYEEWMKLQAQNFQDDPGPSSLNLASEEPISDGSADKKIKGFRARKQSK
jgi:hypothetical protein